MDNRLNFLLLLLLLCCTAIFGQDVQISSQDSGLIESTSQLISGPSVLLKATLFTNMSSEIYYVQPWIQSSPHQPSTRYFIEISAQESRSTFPSMPLGEIQIRVNGQNSSYNYTKVPGLTPRMLASTIRRGVQTAVTDSSVICKDSDGEWFYYFDTDSTQVYGFARVLSTIHYYEVGETFIKALLAKEPIEIGDQLLPKDSRKELAKFYKKNTRVR